MMALAGCAGGPSGTGEGEQYGSIDQGLFEFEPVCITIQRGAGGIVEDADIWQQSPTWNNGAGPTISSGTSASAGVRRGLLRFDLSDVPSSAIVLSADVSVYQQQRTQESFVDVYQVTAPWSEATVNYGNFAEAYDDTVTIDTVFAGGVSFGYRNVDVLDLAQGWVDGSIPNYGILFDEEPVIRTNFRSSESATDRPKLDLCYLEGFGDEEEE